MSHPRRAARPALQPHQQPVSGRSGPRRREYYPAVITDSLLAVLPLILAFALLQRFWKSGLTAGAVK
ncbi:hypothetical protein GCM10010207_51690 [Streptomyces atratus]|nr:hypothetical protein GCM10010207_51690 [Streptomyces atratus]